MRVRLLDAGSIAKRLSKAFDSHDRISIAVAWGADLPHARKLLANRRKFGFVLVGLDFSATDPNLVDQLIGVPNALVVRSRSGCFHPKLYYFETGDEAEAIVGSANFTHGGLGRNVEASVQVVGPADAPFFRQVRSELENYASYGLSVTTDIARTYRRAAEAAARTPRARDPVLPDEPVDWERVNSPLATMSWKAFVQSVRQGPHHRFEGRLRMLRRAGEMFAGTGSFGTLSGPERKAVGGLLKGREAEASALDTYDWGWFGSMGGAGTFASLVGGDAGTLARAIDAIPLRGPVEEAMFDAYAADFTAAFDGSVRTGRLGPATRLLAMKRPDVFACVNGGNVAGLSDALCFARTTVSLQNYWERVILPIRQSPWYNAPRPSDRDMQLWDARVAMVDAIYYSRV